jgi:hypothetical protein
VRDVGEFSGKNQKARVVVVVVVEGEEKTIKVEIKVQTKLELYTCSMPTLRCEYVQVVYKSELFIPKGIFYYAGNRPLWTK